MTEWTCTGQNGLMDQSTICDGIGGCMTTMFPAAAPATFGYTNVRQAFIQGVDTTTTSTAGGACGFGSVPNEQSVAAAPPRTATYSQAYLADRKPQSTRRYQIGFGLGLFTQDKLIPTKFMASQLAIEMTLESAEACIFSLNPESGGGSGSPPTYTLSNINLIPEILEFDASYGI